MNLQVIKNFFIYAFGAFLLKGIAVFIAPIVMRILNPADYGLLSLITNFINILFTCAGLGLRQLLAMEYFHCDTIGRKKVIVDIILVYVVAAVPIFILLFFNVTFINRFVFFNQATTFIISFCLIIAFMKFFVELFYQILQYTGEASILTGIQVAAALIIIVLNLTFLYKFNWGIFSIVAAQFTSIFLVLLISIYFFISQLYYVHLNVACSVKKSAAYIKKGLPFVPRVLFAWVLAMGDRWVLAKYATMTDVGIYSVADMFGQLFQMVIIIPLSYAYIPYLMEKFASNKDRLLSVDRWNLKNMVITMVFLFLAVSVGFVVCKPLVSFVLPQKYHLAMQYIWSLLMGYIFLLGTYFASGLLHFKKCIYFLLVSLLVPAVFNIGLNMLLVPSFAIWGCVIATFLSYLLYFLIIIGYNVYFKKTLKTP
ncbi:lipopolysaccharide biosynthesis protein [Candidatus Dependentiae bacterium]